MHADICVGLYIKGQLLLFSFKPTSAMGKDSVLQEYDAESQSNSFPMFQRNIVPYLQGSKSSQNSLLSDGASYTTRKEFSTLELFENI
jgi:hypothetical protein